MNLLSTHEVPRVPQRLSGAPRASYEVRVKGNQRNQNARVWKAVKGLAGLGHDILKGSRPTGPARFPCSQPLLALISLRVSVNSPTTLFLGLFNRPVPSVIPGNISSAQFCCDKLAVRDVHCQTLRLPRRAKYIMASSALAPVRTLLEERAPCLGLAHQGGVISEDNMGNIVGHWVTS